jgi:hydrogenase-4 component B
MGLLSILCVVFGVAPGLVVSVLDPLAASLLGADISGQIALNGGMLAIPQSTSTSIAPAVLAGFLVVITLVPISIGFLLGGKLRQRAAMTWGCGLEKLEPRMQYTATGFSKPIRMIFSNIYRATHEIEISEVSSPYFHPEVRYELKTESVFLKYLYEPVSRLVLKSARMMRRIQTGHLQSYLAYIFITLVILLLFAR